MAIGSFLALFSPTNIFAPASAPADSIFGLSLFVVGVTSEILAAVVGLLVYAVVGFRTRTDDDGSEPVQVYDSSEVELAWTVIPVLIVVALFLATARVIASVQQPAKPRDAVDVTVVGHRYWWEYRYPSWTDERTGDWGGESCSPDDERTERQR